MSPSTHDRSCAAILVRLDYEAKLREADQKLNDQRFISQEKAVESALRSADKAVTKSEEAVTKRLESGNEFRQTLTDQAATFLKRVEFEQTINNLKERLDETSGLQNTRMGELATRLTMIESRGQGTSAAWVWVVAAIGSLIGVAGIVVAAVALSRGTP